jgi:hypothetical protein
MILVNGELSKGQRAHEVIEATSTAARLVLHPLFASVRCQPMQGADGKTSCSSHISIHKLFFCAGGCTQSPSLGLKVCQLKVVCE